MSSNIDKSKLKERAILRERLVALRRELAFQHGKEAAYLIFNNTTLDDLVLKMPRSEKTMMQIKGIKEKKFEMYGSAVIKVIREYNKEFHPPAPRVPKGNLKDVNISGAGVKAHISHTQEAETKRQAKKQAPHKHKTLATKPAPKKAKPAAVKKAPPKAKTEATKKTSQKLKTPSMVPGSPSVESYPPRISKTMTIAELKEEANCRGLEKKNLPKTKPELLHHLVSGSIRLGRTHEFKEYHKAQDSKMSFQRFEVISQTYNALLEQMKQEESALLTTSLAELKGEQAKKDAQKQKAFEEWAKTKGGFDHESPDSALSLSSSTESETDFTEYDTGRAHHSHVRAVKSEEDFYDQDYYGSMC